MLNFQYGVTMNGTASRIPVKTRLPVDMDSKKACALSELNQFCTVFADHLFTDNGKLLISDGPSCIKAECFDEVKGLGCQ